MPEQKQTYEQVLGSTVHAVLERLLKTKPESRTPEAIQITIESTVLRFGRKALFDQSTLEQLRSETDKLVLGYLATDGADAMPLALERMFELRLNDGTTIRTRVDRVDRRGAAGDDVSPSYEIVDYKTGRNQLEPGDLARETAPIVQLHAVGGATDGPVERVTWLYLRSGESVTWWPEEEDVEAATSHLLDTIRQIQADCDFDPSPGGHCAWCPFKRDCPEWTGSADAEAAQSTSAPADAGFESAVDEAA
jgi:putative RecB family exonuclease